jgi:hypothetical protein
MTQRPLPRPEGWECVVASAIFMIVCIAGIARTIRSDALLFVLGGVISIWLSLIGIFMAVSRRPPDEP